jgi:MSHA biogenesis protein MshO
MRQVDAMRRCAKRQLGFTLIEAIMVIVITGIVAGMVAVFIRKPIEAYVDTARRAALADLADTVSRRIARELQGALPNSVRLDPATGSVLEFIPIHDAGRYRAEAGPSAADDPLVFGSIDTSFDVLGPTVSVAAGDSLVVYNLGIAGADAYEMPTQSSRRAATQGPGLSKVSFTSTAPLSFASPSSRFQIVGTPVAFVCSGGRLLRYAEYGYPNPSTTTATTSFGAAVPAVLATNVTACNFAYSPGALQQNGLVSMLLSFADPAQPGEVVTLQHQVNVDNVP